MRINKVLQVVIGNRQTIRQSSASGTASGFLMAILFTTYYAFFQFDIAVEDLHILKDFDLGLWYVAACLSIGFVAVGGRSIGWLLIRPVATILQNTFPQLGSKKIWVISTTSIWVLITFFTLHPYQLSTPLLKVVLLTGIFVWVTISGVIGGILAARTTTATTYRESREYIAIGSTITGGSLIGLQTLTNFILSPTMDITKLSGLVVGFCLSLSALSFVALFPYMLIEPLSTLLSKLNLFNTEFHTAYVLVSGIVWTIIGYFFFGRDISTSTNISQGVIYVLAMGLCGACGGWAIGQYKVIAPAQVITTTTSQ